MRKLLDWADQHRALLAEFPMWKDAVLDFRIPTPRQGLIRSVVGNAPQLALTPKSGFTARNLAVISLLAGSLPEIKIGGPEGEGYTVADIVDLETKYIREADRKKMYIQPSMKRR